MNETDVQGLVEHPEKISHRSAGLFGRSLQNLLKRLSWKKCMAWKWSGLQKDRARERLTRASTLQLVVVEPSVNIVRGLVEVLEVQGSLIEKVHGVDHEVLI